MASDDGLNRLEGTPNNKGGLFIRKKTNTNDELFKHPGKSLLGLDVLAKSRNRVESNSRKRRVEDNSPDGLSESIHKQIAK